MINFTNKIEENTGETVSLAIGVVKSSNSQPYQLTFFFIGKLNAFSDCRQYFRIQPMRSSMYCILTWPPASPRPTTSQTIPKMLNIYPSRWT